MYAAIEPSATWRLVQALNTLKDRDGRILIDGFYDGIQPVSDQERKIIITLATEE